MIPFVQWMNSIQYLANNLITKTITMVYIKKDRILTQEQLDEYAKEVRAHNSAKFLEMISDPNWIENIAKKYLGDKWEIVYAYENHPNNRSAWEYNKEYHRIFAKNKYHTKKEEMKAARLKEKNGMNKPISNDCYE